MQPTNTSYDGWIGRDAYDASGEKIGEITDVFYDDRTGRPEWLSVKMGMFKGSTFVPIHGSQVHQSDDSDEDNLRLAFTKEMIKGAPRIDIDDSLTPVQEQELWSYYGYDYNADPKLKTYGYGSSYTKNRFDKDFSFNRWESEHKDWSAQQRTHDEHMETVPVQATAQVEVPIDAQVRLRRYQTTKQGTKTVQVPTTETEEHVEVEDVSAQARQGQRQ